MDRRKFLRTSGLGLAAVSLARDSPQGNAATAREHTICRSSQHEPIHALPVADSGGQRQPKSAAASMCNRRRRLLACRRSNSRILFNR